MKTIDDYERSLEVLIRNGYKPIAVTTITCEETFVFETEEEAKKAYDQFEKNHNKIDIVQGWWYGRSYFMETLDWYEQRHGLKAEVIWLIEPPKIEDLKKN